MLKQKRKIKKKKKKTKYYIHPIDQLDPNLDRQVIKDRKLNERMITIFMVFLIVACILVPAFEIISDLLEHGLYKNIEGI